MRFRTMPARRVSRFPKAPDNTDAVLDEFEGDASEAIRALLHDLAVLATDYEGDVSHGFVRREPPWLRRRRIR